MKGKINVSKGQGVNVYPLADNTSASFAVLESGDNVNVLAVKGDYVQISCNGIFGWVVGKFVTIDQSNLNGLSGKFLSKIKKAVKTAINPVKSTKAAINATKQSIKTAAQVTKASLNPIKATKSALNKNAVKNVINKTRNAALLRGLSGYQTGDVVTVNTAGGVNIRSGASTSSAKVTSAPNGAKLTVASPTTTFYDGHEWLQVTYNGKTGYVAAEYIKASTITPPSAATSGGGSETAINNQNTDNNMVALSENAKTWIKRVAIGAAVAGAAYGIYKVATKKDSSKGTKTSLSGIGRKRRKKSKSKKLTYKKRLLLR